MEQNSIIATLARVRSKDEDEALSRVVGQQSDIPGVPVAGDTQSQDDQAITNVLEVAGKTAMEAPRKVLLREKSRI